MKKIHDSRFQEAFNHLNKNLFSGSLPGCVITLIRGRKYQSIYYPKKSAVRAGADARKDEICLNIDHFRGMSDKQILAILAHEMCHQWQHHFGNPSRKGYHNVQWFEKMRAVGLEPKGKGRKVYHDFETIRSDGRFWKVVYALIHYDGFRLNWQSYMETEPDDQNKTQRRTRIKYSCASCGASAWGAPNLAIVCGGCGLQMIPADGDMPRMDLKVLTREQYRKIKERYEDLKAAYESLKSSKYGKRYPGAFYVDDVEKELFKEFVRAGFKALSKKYHPDCGGSNGHMQTVNALNEKLMKCG